MKTRLLILLTFVFALNTYAQKSTRIELKKDKSFTEKSVKKSANGFRFIETINDINITEKETKEGSFLEMTSDGMTKSFDKGNPNLPLISRLIEIPENATAKVNVISFNEQIIKLQDYKLTKEIIPARASISKSTDPNDVPFVKNKDVYSKNAFLKMIL